ncbi:TRAP transporter substrate-binding protein DctP [Pacificibacter sp. AS14]|uniref:TRAP transporter substrate-binding protein DctP n=1 Tax=Pacificibacter sp. AS14 TaxID=3135785 RepID=UPI00316C9603
MTTFTRILTAGTLALSLTSTAAMADIYRLATNVSETSTAGQLLTEFADAVAERTEGRVEFRMFNDGVLGEQAQYFQQIQRGVIDAGLVNSGTLENVAPAVGVMNLPYVFRTSEEYAQVMTAADVQKALFDATAEHNVVPLGFISSGFRSIYTTSPVESFEDIQGMKLRAIASPTYMEMLSLFGAVPTPLPFGELYAGLQQGIVDGAEGGLAGLYVAQFGEVAKYALLTNQTRLTDFVVTSNRFNDSVDPADLAIVREAFEVISLKSIEFSDASEAADLQKAVDEMGVQVIDVDTAPFIDAVHPMYEAARADDAKQALIEAIFAIEHRDF